MCCDHMKFDNIVYYAIFLQCAHSQIDMFQLLDAIFTDKH